MPTIHPHMNMSAAMLGAPVEIRIPTGAVLIWSEYDEELGKDLYHVAGRDCTVAHEQFGRIAEAWTYALDQLTLIKEGAPPSAERIAAWRKL